MDGNSASGCWYNSQSGETSFLYTQVYSIQLRMVVPILFYFLTLVVRYKCRHFACLNKLYFHGTLSLLQVQPSTVSHPAPSLKGNNQFVTKLISYKILLPDYVNFLCRSKVVGKLIVEACCPHHQRGTSQVYCPHASQLWLEFTLNIS